MSTYSKMVNDVQCGILHSIFPCGWETTSLSLFLMSRLHPSRSYAILSHSQLFNYALSSCLHNIPPTSVLIGSPHSIASLLVELFFQCIKIIQPTYNNNNLDNNYVEIFKYVTCSGWNVFQCVEYLQRGNLLIQTSCSKSFSPHSGYVSHNTRINYKHISYITARL